MWLTPRYENIASMLRQTLARHMSLLLSMKSLLLDSEAKVTPLVSGQVKSHCIKALASAADISCIEIVSRTARSRECRTVIMKVYQILATAAL